MSRPLRKPIALALAAATATMLAACGDSHTAVFHGDNTGAGGVGSSYLSLGGLRYQVEVSRKLNPGDNEDKGYLTGIPATQKLGPGQAWFGVFLLVLNRSGHTEPAANSFVLSDTQGNSYQPLTLGPQNLYAYRPQKVANNNQLPIPGTTAFDGPTQAALLLYRIPLTAYQNVPLVLRIGAPAQTAQTVSVILDV